MDLNDIIKEIRKQKKDKKNDFSVPKVIMFNGRMGLGKTTYLKSQILEPDFEIKKDCKNQKNVIFLSPWLVGYGKNFKYFLYDEISKVVKQEKKICFYFLSFFLAVYFFIVKGIPFFPTFISKCILICNIIFSSFCFLIILIIELWKFKKIRNNKKINFFMLIIQIPLFLFIYNILEKLYTSHINNVNEILVLIFCICTTLFICSGFYVFCVTIMEKNIVNIIFFKKDYDDYFSNEIIDKTVAKIGSRTIVIEDFDRLSSTSQKELISVINLLESKPNEFVIIITGLIDDVKEECRHDFDRIIYYKFDFNEIGRDLLIERIFSEFNSNAFTFRDYFLIYQNIVLEKIDHRTFNRVENKFKFSDKKMFEFKEFEDEGAINYFSDTNNLEKNFQIQNREKYEKFINFLEENKKIEYSKIYSIQEYISENIDFSGNSSKKIEEYYNEIQFFEKEYKKIIGEYIVDGEVNLIKMYKMIIVMISSDYEFDLESIICKHIFSDYKKNIKE